MISYNSQSGEGKYKLQIETDNRKYFEMIEEMVRLMIDKELYFRVYNEALAVSINPESNKVCKIEDPGVPAFNSLYGNMIPVGEMIKFNEDNSINVDVKSPVIDPFPNVYPNVFAGIFDNVSPMDCLTVKDMEGRINVKKDKKQD